MRQAVVEVAEPAMLRLGPRLRSRARCAVLAFGLLVATSAVTGACGRADAPGVDADRATSPVAEPEAAHPSVDSPPPGDPSARASPGRVAPAPESQAPQSPALPLELSSPEHQRYQRLRLETLRAMIEAAKLALPIGPFQERIDAAARIALDDVSEAADRMEVIVAELQEAIAAAGR